MLCGTVFLSFFLVNCHYIPRTENAALRGTGMAGHVPACSPCCNIVAKLLHIRPIAGRFCGGTGMYWGEIKTPLRGSGEASNVFRE